jgi:aminoglycoside phosphotransferase (APT) family kinase protein
MPPAGAAAPQRVAEPAARLPAGFGAPPAEPSVPRLLAEPEIVVALLELGLLTARQVVDGELVVTAAERRNRNIKVVVPGGRCLLTKQAKSPEAVRTLRHEAAALAALTATADALSPHLPRMLHFDPGRCLLVLELVEGGRSVHELSVRGGRVAAGHGQLAGRVLALAHRRDAPAELGPARVPATLQLHRPHAGLLRDISRANLRLLEAVQSDAELTCALDGLGRGWRPRGLIHGDAKWDNMVVSAPPDPRFLLVDWELAAAGDPRWDVGTVLSTFLSAWVMSIPMAADADLARMLRRAWFPLTRSHPAARRFWRSYAGTAGLAGAAEEEFRDEAVAYCGGRLVQTAYEYLQLAAHPTANAICLVQLAANILRAPQRAAEVLLGLDGASR